MGDMKMNRRRFGQAAAVAGVAGTALLRAETIAPKLGGKAQSVIFLWNPKDSPAKATRRP